MFGKNLTVRIRNALGSRARKASEGVLTVRFEMPFAVWCSTCPKPTIIGQGVRFNAEKKKVGNYHSSPIWAFRMKHTACGGWIEIRTDPRNTEYVVTEGGKRRDTGEDRIREGDLEIKTEEEKRRIQEDAFAALEVKIDDRKQAAADKHRVDELYESRDRDWSDPSAMNKKIRKTFRMERKDLERKADVTEKLKDKMSLGIDLVEETEEDRKLAELASFGKPGDGDDQGTISRAKNRALFLSSLGNSGEPSTKSKGDDGARKAHQALRSELAQNTRSSLDIFEQSTHQKTDIMLPGLKRKRPSSGSGSAQPLKAESSAVALVEYDSD